MKTSYLTSVFLSALLTIATTNAPAEAQGLGQTKLTVKNDSNAAVTVYLTLGAYPNFYPSNPGFVQDVTQVTFTPPVTWTGSGLQGSFTLARGAKVSYTSPAGTAISGNLSFGTPPLLCPPVAYPNGINLAEFTLNNNTPAYVQSPQAVQPQESTDISCVNGVNCRIVCNLNSNNPPTYSGGPWLTAGGASVTSMSNLTLGTKPNSPNLNRNGVYPPGCDDCTSSVNPGCNSVWLNWGNVNKKANCTLVRTAATQSGGEVQVLFKQFY
ncbi:hypothetical protein KF707_00525 [Candidatus Obscuribacterales bacterium]|nr:hypothetical protein [Candidatus Obscuribacterales bacterium]